MRATATLLHNCYQITARAALWSLVGPLALAALTPGSLGGALIVGLAGLIPAIGACLLFLLAAGCYSLASDTHNGWRAPLALLAGASLCSGVLLWAGFFAIAAV